MRRKVNISTLMVFRNQRRTKEEDFFISLCNIFPVWVEKLCSIDPRKLGPLSQLILLCSDKAKTTLLLLFLILKSNWDLQRTETVMWKLKASGYLSTFWTTCRTSVYPMVRDMCWGCTTIYKLFHSNFERGHICVLYLLLISCHCISFRLF